MTKVILLVLLIVVLALTSCSYAGAYEAVPVNPSTDAWVVYDQDTGAPLRVCYFERAQSTPVVTCLPIEVQ